MEKYEKYKDSGVVWIGEIPSSWDFLKVRHTFYLKGRIGWQGLKADEFIDKGPYLVTGTDFQNGRVNWRTCYHISDERYNEAPEIHVHNGDVLITKDGTVGKMAFIEDKPEKVSLNSHLLIVRPLLHSICNKYVYWAFQTSSFDYYKGLSQTGSIMESLSQDKIASFIMPFPSYEEQQSIANYLDSRCSKIDHVIATQQKRVELLKELKQSIITRAVTRGINPNAKMKDSGVEWIGEIPEHWEIKRVKQIAAISNGSDPKFSGDIPVYGSGAESFKTCGEFKEGPCVLLGRKGATLHIPHYIEGRYWNVDTAFDVKTNSDFCLKLFFYLAMLFDYGYYTMTTTLPSMTQTDYGNMRIPVPPIYEQQQIVSYIEKQFYRLDSSITKALRQIELLKEYKQSLITEVVTGKRKVV